MKARIAVATLLLAFAGLANAQMNALPQARHVLVYGQAQARAIPDRYRIQVSFDVVDAKADAARAKVEAMMRDTLGKLRSAGVPDGDIIATSLQIDPRQEYAKFQSAQVYKGIGVKRSITATFDDQAKLRQFLAVLQTSQELQVSGVTTSLSSEDELKRQLRMQTIESTKRKAEEIAKSYGARLAGIYSVSDTPPEFQYGIRKGEWRVEYQWAGNGRDRTLSRVPSDAYGSPASSEAPPSESFQAGYVTFTDTLYAVFLIAD